MATDAIVYTVWKHGLSTKKMSRELSRSLRTSLQLWNYVPIFIWGLDCTDINIDLALSLSCFDIEDGILDYDNHDCSHARPLMLPGRIYASKFNFYKRRQIPEHILLTRRYLTFEPLLKLGITRAVYLDTDTFGVRKNAIQEILDYSRYNHSGAVFTKRCSYTYGDRLNFSHPLVLARNIRDTVNTGVIGFVNLRKWCINWGRSRNDALKLYLSHISGEKVTFDVFHDQTLASAIFAQQTLKISPMYNFRIISGDNLAKCDSPFPISIHHMHM